jgi:DNA modification methylase
MQSYKEREALPDVNRIIVGDALDELRKMPDGIFDTCVTSPPYYGLRDYGVDGQIGLEASPEEYIDKLVDIFREIKRTLKPDGTLWIVISDSYAGSGKGAANYPENAKKYKQGTSKGMLGATATTKVKTPGIKEKDLIGIPWMLAFALRADGWYLRQDIIWQKPNAMPESVRDRCTKSHEYIFMLSKCKHYYYDADAIKEPCVNGDPQSPRGSRGAKCKNAGLRKQDAINKRQYTGLNDRYSAGQKRKYRNKRDVWSVSTHGFADAHFATFPPALIEPCILAGSRRGGTVLDPFIGSGTTAEVANRLGRNYVGIDLNPAYVDMAKKRIEK